MLKNFRRSHLSVRITGRIKKVHQNTEAPRAQILEDKKPEQRNALTPTSVPKLLEEGSAVHAERSPGRT